MSRLLKPLASCLVVAAIAGPACVQAADNVAVACSVNVDYTRNNNLVERYAKDFVVAQDAAYVDDFGNRIRFKQFTASVTRDSGNTVVAFDYYNDVGVFHAVAFNSSLTIRGGGDIQSTSGSYSFSTSNLVQPGSVSGNHVTSYLLACRRL